MTVRVVATVRVYCLLADDGSKHRRGHDAVIGVEVVVVVVVGVDVCVVFMCEKVYGYPTEGQMDGVNELKGRYHFPKTKESFFQSVIQ